ncbi:MAG: type II secretion system GspH family protein [Lentisphaerales bacterium]|nr:type II secretion system GspH family protein [Lentisphaerales bacterium]
MRKLNFTLTELLVVIAMITLLMTLLIPAINNSKDMGKRLVCLNNTRTWGVGSMMYHKENLKFWDANNYPYRSGGKKGNSGWGRPRVSQRPVNKFLNYTTDGEEVAAALCPNDTYWRVDKTHSAYDFLGISYCDNMAQNTISRRGGNNHRSLRNISASLVENPSTCLLFMEWPVVSQSYRPNEDFPSWHKKQQFFNVTMVDGSATFLKILVRQVSSEKFNFEYDK